MQNSLATPRHAFHSSPVNNNKKNNKIWLMFKYTKKCQSQIGKNSTATVEDERSNIFIIFKSTNFNFIGQVHRESSDKTMYAGSSLSCKVRLHWT